jgi:hypothetical protein
MNRGPLRLLAAAALLACAARAQDESGASRPSRSAPPFGAVTRPSSDRPAALRYSDALTAGDDAGAAEALAEALEPRANRGAALASTLNAAETTGRLDLWLVGAKAVADAEVADPAAAYFVGFVLQRAKLLGRADPYLARAASLDPRSPEIRSAYAWNAFFRFDSDEAVRRAQAGDFPSRSDLLTAKLAESTVGREAAGLTWTAVVAGLAAFAWILRRALR